LLNSHLFAEHSFDLEKLIVSFFLSTTRHMSISLFGIAFPLSALAQPAPTVTGIQGCLMTDNSTIRGDAGGVPGLEQNVTAGLIAQCNVSLQSGQAPEPGSSSNMTYGEYATVGSINAAFNSIQTQINAGAGGITSVVTDGVTIIGDGVGSPLRLADGIVNQINSNTVLINNLDNRVTGLEQGSVLYNRDSAGVKTGGVTFNDGLGGPVRLSNVAAGTLDADAINLLQLKSVVDGLGGGAVVNSDGSITGPSYKLGASTYSNVGEALTGIYDSGTRYSQANSTAAGSVASGARSMALGGDAIASHANSIALGEGSKTDRANSIAVGSLGNERQIAFVAAGTLDTDAVNVLQIRSVTDGLGGGAKINPDGTVTGPTYYIGGNTYTNVGDAITNIYVAGTKYFHANTAGEDSISAAPSSVAIGGGALAAHTNSVALGEGSLTDRVNSVSVGSVGNVRQITHVAAGTMDSDAANYGQIKNQVSYDMDSRGARSNSITLQGGVPGAPVKIANLAYGTAPADAANMQNLWDAAGDTRAYTDSKFYQLTGEVRANRREARSGTALSLATASLRFDDRAGKISFAGGGGTFVDTAGLAMGVGYTNQAQNARFNAAFSASPSTGNVGFSLGASVTLN
jgi:autotransporter adhesin